MIGRQKMYLSDYYMSIGDLRSDEIDGFEVRDVTTRFLPYDNTFWNSITYELSLTRHSYTRTVTTIFDFLGTIGGLFSAISLFFTFCIAAIMYRGSYMKLTNEMTA